MSDETRQNIRDLNQQRRTARAQLSGDVEQAKYDLHPRSLARRWTDDKRAKLNDLVDDGKHSLKKNAPLIGLAGTAILLFAVRKPIFKTIEQYRQKAKDPKS
jgi:hypothetical protein